MITRYVSAKRIGYTIDDFLKYLNVMIFKTKFNFSFDVPVIMF